MKPLVVDVEGSRDGHVFNYDHKMYVLGLYNGEQSWIFPIEWNNDHYGHVCEQAQKIIDSHDLIIAFNIKHDILWLRRYGIKTSHKPLFCLQFAEYCLSGQKWRMPDLDTACKNRGLPGKTFHIKENYWDKGKEINEAPWAEAAAYNENDLKIEFSLFEKQKELLSDDGNKLLKRLIWEGSQDIGITAEMEWNGITYDSELSLQEGNRRLDEIQALKNRLQILVPILQINWDSPQHLSAVLYGGKIKYEDRETYEFIYADPKRPPTTKTRRVEKSIQLPRLCEPLPNTGLAKEGYFSTDEGILRRLKPKDKKARDIIDINLDIRGLNKLVGTYYHGIPKLAKEKNWQDGTIHGQLHHCVTQTGRLSSSSPNQQNLEYGVRQCLVTRFSLKKS